MPRLMQVFSMLLCLVMPLLPAQCQNSDLKHVLSANNVAFTIKTSDLDDNWLIVSLNGRYDSSALSRLYSQPAANPPSNPNYYTRGQTIVFCGETFLAAYNAPAFSYFVSKGNASEPPLPTPDTVLRLSLINVHQVASLDDVRVYDVVQVKQQARQQAVNADSESNLKRIGFALTLYIQDADDLLPPMKTVAEADEALYPFLKNRRLFEQPGTHELYQINTFLSKRNIATFGSAATTVVYYEARPSNDGKRAVLFLDGHVNRISEAQWPALKSAFHVPSLPTPKPSPSPPS